MTSQTPEPDEPTRYQKPWGEESSTTSGEDGGEKIDLSKSSSDSEPYSTTDASSGQGAYGTPPPAPSAPSYTGSYTGGYPQAPAASFGASPYGATVDHPQANTAMILGIVALAGGLFCTLLFVLGPFAWSMGAKTLREIRESGGQYSGEGSAKAGMVCGIIATVLLILLVLFLAVIFIAALAQTS